ncbi:cupin domain-containing protein [Ferruginibacter paludis]|uniref:cupin domain-containing protein n=1 Tax=Ferruginibacter paludis TaxID=1310417 RepID=UPI0025B61C7E|nr:cupin domain-containing protein [Ferruginibacter paludis]MDN3659435.1 cupin domain-containing protein [Ferruginibacter paludis]
MPFIELENLPEKEIFPGFTARGIHTGTMSFIYWDVKAGAEVPEHNHLHEQVANVLRGRFELTVNGETTILEPGTVAIIPPYAVHSGRAITACELLDVFTPEREDYKF